MLSYVRSYVILNTEVSKREFHSSSHGEGTGYGAITPTRGCIMSTHRFICKQSLQRINDADGRYGIAQVMVAGVQRSPRNPQHIGAE